MKKTIFLILAFISVLGASASTTWDLQGVKYTVDTVYHAYIGPGTTQTELKLSGAVNLKVFYTTTDLTNDKVGLRVIMGKDNLTSTVTVPNMPQYHGDTSNMFFAGVNADFFSTGPIGTTVANNILYKSYKGTGWYGFAVDKNKKPYIGAPYTTFKMVSPNGGQFSIKAVNGTRSSNELILYTSVKGSTTGTNTSGTEVGAVAVDGGLKSNGTTKMRVTVAPVKGVGNMSIPAGGCVLSGNGFMEASLAKMQVGEEFEITPTIYMDNVEISNIVEMAGGCPVLLKGGVIQNTQGLLDHLVTRQPRTAVGYNTTGDKLVMLVVDGRQSGISEGVTSRDLAAIMANVGCSEALNFDGGGSTTMYVKELGVRNTPSEGSLRPVKDGLFLSTPTTSNRSIASIRFVDYVKNATKGTVYNPVIYGYNTDGVLVNSSVAGFSLSCGSSLGTVSSSGTSVTLSGSGTQALVANYGGLTATIPVTIIDNSGINDVETSTKPHIYPNPAIKGEICEIFVSKITEVSIFNINGQLMSSIQGDGELEIPTDNLSQGIYLVKITDSERTITDKLIIK